MAVGINIERYKIFEQLYRNSYETLERIAYYFVRDNETAKDIVSKTFLDVLESGENVDSSNLLPYMFVSVRNACLQYRRNQAIHQKVYDNILERDRGLYEIYSTAIENTDPSELLTDEILGICKDTIGKMPRQVSDIFMKNRIEGMTYKEIAKKLNISTIKVDRSIRHALKDLRIALADYLYLFIVFFISIFK